MSDEKIKEELLELIKNLDVYFIYQLLKKAQEYSNLSISDNIGEYTSAIMNTPFIESEILIDERIFPIKVNDKYLISEMDGSTWSVD